MAASPRETVSLRVQGAIYSAAFVYFGTSWVSALIVPLLLVQLGTPQYLIGIVIGARAFLSVILSIHGGALMDRLGTRRVMIGFAVISVITPLLFPISPWIPALIALQMIGGLADAMGWIGAQALSGSAMQGNPRYVGNMTTAARIGGCVAPLLMGRLWEHFGPWGAFGAASLWSFVGLVAVLMLPKEEGTRAAAEAGTRVHPGDLMPRLADYVAAFRLVAIPAVALVLMITMIRVGGTGVQTSFYVVYLEEIRIGATEIGDLLSIANFCAILAPQFAAPLTRRFSPHWTIVVVVLLTVLTISSTPLLGGMYLLLALVIGLRGICLGISQPLEISIMSRPLGSDGQGKGVGLRTTASRVSTTIVPPIMGGIASFVGLENSFLVLGAILVLAMIGAAWFVYRNPALGRRRTREN